MTVSLGEVCCAASGVILLTRSGEPDPSFTRGACLSRCGPACAGVGSMPPYACVGCYHPYNGTTCAPDGVRLHDWRFRASSGCDRWSCRVPGSRQHYASKLTEPVTVAFSGLRNGSVEFSHPVPTGSRIVGRSVSGGELLSVVSGTATFVHPVDVERANFTGGGAVTVLMPRHRAHGGGSTTLSEFASGGPVLITPSDTKKAHSGVGDVSVVSRVGRASGPFDVIVRGTEGRVTVDASARVLLYETEAGMTELVGAAESNVMNLSAMLSLFSPEYLVEFENNGTLHRGRPVPEIVRRFWVVAPVVAAFVWYTAWSLYIVKRDYALRRRVA